MLLNTADTASLPQLATSTEKRVILVVDDSPENILVLVGHLREAGYDVISAPNGPRALELVRHRVPDLVLLDIMMPVMDGFKVCEEMKADPIIRDVPVIFVTARAHTDDVVHGLHVGAVDYITKPINSQELLARVRTHVELKVSRDLLLTYNNQLQRITSHLRRLNENKNKLLGIISHDIRGAFSNVVSVANLLTGDEAVPKDEASELISALGIEAEYMIALAENLLNVDAIERRSIQLKSERVEVAALMDFAIHTHHVAAQAKRLTFDISADNSIIFGDLLACRQILANLLSNAIKYSHPGGKIWLSGNKIEPGRIILSVQDQGPGISIEDQAKLFTPFTRLAQNSVTYEHSIGLGLSIVKFMAEEMHGEAECISSPGEGSLFRVTLPGE